MMKRETAYRTIGQHLFVAYKAHGDGLRTAIILADDLREAQEKALIHYGYSSEAFERIYRGCPLIFVHPVQQTADPQIYLTMATEGQKERTPNN